MENEIEDQSEKKIKPRFEHVALNEVSVQKINRWFEQINAKKKIKLSRKDLLNWVIEKSPENFSNNELNAIIENFYDNEAYLRQLLREVKKAKADGSEETLDLIVRSKRPEIKKDSSSLE